MIMTFASMFKVPCRQYCLIVRDLCYLARREYLREVGVMESGPERASQTLER
jgi:hypothetical protein